MTDRVCPTCGEEMVELDRDRYCVSTTAEPVLRERHTATKLGDPAARTIAEAVNRNRPIITTTVHVHARTLFRGAE